MQSFEINKSCFRYSKFLKLPDFDYFCNEFLFNKSSKLLSL